MKGEAAAFMVWIEAVVALVIMLGFVMHSFFAFTPTHVQHHPTRVRIGAGIQGLMVGLAVGFVMLPLRTGYMEFQGMNLPGVPYISTLALLPAFLLLWIIRRGALLKAPYVKTYLRAYRRASLLKQRDDANRALAKLDVIEGRKAAA